MKAPLISVGQVYLHEGLDEYIVVIKNNLGQVHFKGIGVGGSCEDYKFIHSFLPVDPEDLSDDEREEMQWFLQDGQELLVGFIKSDEDSFIEEDELDEEME